MDNTYSVGQVVKFVAAWCNPAELGREFVVVEANGDRLIVTPKVCDLPLPPRELVRDFMLMPA